jgi:hypothetical protein
MLEDLKLQNVAVLSPFCSSVSLSLSSVHGSSVGTLLFVSWNISMGHIHILKMGMGSNPLSFVQREWTVFLI